MDPLTLGTIARYCGGILLQGTPSATGNGVSTDTRSLRDGEVFVALKGENFNGNEFVLEAQAKGASVVVVSELPRVTEELGCGIIRVRDTLKALQLLAKNYRDHLDLAVVAVTGSSGKTSTKDFLGAVLGERFAVNATRGNLNNHIGLPLTMLQTDGTHTCGVWEMGMSAPGEIEVLAELASPDVGVITNVGVAHLEFMKNREGIAKEKGMLAEAVPAEGCVVLSADDDFTERIRERTAARVLTAGLKGGDVRAERIRFDENGCEFDLKIGGRSVEAFIPASGKHMVKNALLAAAVGMHLGLETEEIVAGLRRAKLAGGRLEKKVCGGVVYIDDSYNANPESVRAAIDTLAEMPCRGKRVSVLGAMAELGEDAAAEHRAIGTYLAESGIDELITVGEDAAPIGEGAEGMATNHFPDHAAAAAYLKEHTGKGDLVLVKGSRSSRMEKVLEEVMGA